MITVLAFSLIFGPTMNGSLGSHVSVHESLKAGEANRNGVALIAVHPVGFEPKRVLAFTTSPTLRNGRYFNASPSGFITKLADGVIVGDRRFNNQGTFISQLPDLVVNGANSKGDVAGYSRDPSSKLDRATSVVEGKREFRSFAPDPDYVAALDQFLLFSKAFDIDEEGRILVTSLPPKAQIYKEDALRPYLIDKGKQTLLPSPFESADVFPLKFGFDGSIIGKTYAYSTIVETGWSGGIGEAKSTAFMRWKWINSKLAHPSVTHSPDGFTIYDLRDASGRYVIGSIRNESTKSINHALWVNGSLTNFKTSRGVSIDSYLGFVKSNTIACLGNVNGKWSLFTIVLPKQ